MRKRNQKYNNKKVVVDGITFDSKKEHRMFEVLTQMQQDGLIRDLEMKVVYELQPRHTITKKGIERIIRPLTYIPDYRFFDIQQNRTRILDAKGARTEVYKIKRKLFDYKFQSEGLYIEETL